MQLTWTLITGGPRSGTTLFSELINLHPGAAILHEVGLSDVVRSLAKLSSVTTLDERETKLDEARTGQNDTTNGHQGSEVSFQTDPRIEQTDIFYNMRAASSIKSLSVSTAPNMALLNSLARGYFNALYPDKTLRLVGDKMPNVGKEEIDYLSSILEDLRFVFIIRHPVDAINSSIRRATLSELGRDDWHTHTVHDAISRWISAWNTMGEVCRSSARPICIVKYDRLCDSTQQEMEKVFRFLDLPVVELTRTPQPLPPELRRLFVSKNDLREINDHLGDLINKWDASESLELLRLYPTISQLLPFDDWIEFRDANSNRGYLVSGFSDAEPHGTWSDGHQAQIKFRHHITQFDLLVELSLVDAIFSAERVCHLTITINDGLATLFQLETVPKTISLLVPRSALDENGEMTIIIKIAHPKDKHDGPDYRALGVCLKALRVTAF